MIRHSIITLLVSSLVAFSASASNEFRIAAIVNDAVISSLDLSDRVNLALVTSGRPNTPEIRQRAAQELLQALIDETLRLQEAKRYSILISSDEIERAVRTLEESQNRPSGALRQFIERNGLSFDSFKQQIEAQVAWQKLLKRRVRRDIIITDDEVFRAQKRMARGRKIEEVQIASIVLPIAKDASPEDVLGIARDIRSQLMAGADAPSLLSAYNDRVPLEFGPVTWIAKEQLNPTIHRVVEPLDKGGIAEPVRTPVGYQIIRLLDTRMISTVPDENAEVALKQIILKLDNRSADAEIESKMEIARSIAKYPGSCTEMGIAGLQDFDGLKIDVNYIRTTLTNMAPDVRHLVEPLPVTGITEPFASEDGIHLLMLCEKIVLPAPLPDKEQVRQVLFNEKIELESEKYLRRLRREAFIDIRA